MSSTQGAPHGSEQAIAAQKKKPSAFSGVERRQQPHCQLGLLVGGCYAYMFDKGGCNKSNCAYCFESVDIYGTYFH